MRARSSWRGWRGVDDPERKRRIIGEIFIRVFERTAREAGKEVSLLVQGTLYPDVIESLSVRGTVRDDQDPSQRGAGSRTTCRSS